MRPQHARSIILVSCFLILIGYIPAYSQTQDDIMRLQDQIMRNEELLQRAKELVNETNSLKARTALETAAHLHAECKAAFNAGAGDGNMLRAGQLAVKAREAILQTIAIARREAKLEENATRAIERAAHRLEQARQLLSEQDDRDSNARKLLEESHTHLQRSRDNMREHRFESSLRLAASAEDLANRAIALMRRDVTDSEAVERELEKTDRILDRVGDRLDGDIPGPIRRMAGDARELQRRAKTSYRDERYRLALDMTHEARNAAMRALKLLTSRADRENVEQAIGLTDALLAEAREIARNRDAERLLGRIEHAANLQEQAKRHLHDGSLENALRMTLRARGVLKDALAGMRGSIDEREVNATLSETDAILARVREALSESDDGDALELLARAQSRQESAWEEFRQHRLRAALAHTKLARRMAQRAVRLLNNEDI